jgi:hypothetical protein
VESLEDGVLTLRFTRDGDLKGFATSNCDADLKRVLSEGFGLNVAVSGVAGGATAPQAPPPRAAPSMDAPAPVRRDPTPAFDGPPPQDSYEPDEDADDDPLPPGPPELTGTDLIQHALGGQVISETEN